MQTHFQCSWCSFINPMSVFECLNCETVKGYVVRKKVAKRRKKRKLTEFMEVPINSKYKPRFVFLGTKDPMLGRFFLCQSFQDQGQPLYLLKVKVKSMCKTEISKKWKFFIQI